MVSFLERLPLIEWGKEGWEDTNLGEESENMSGSEEDARTRVGMGGWREREREAIKINELAIAFI